MRDKIDFIIEQHRSTNHMYDTYLPYERNKMGKVV
jgi:hypothetical protein